MKTKTKAQLAKEWYEELDYLFKKSMAEIQEAKKAKKKDISQNNNDDEQYVPFKKFKGLLTLSKDR